MTNGKALAMFGDINYLLDCSINKTYKVQDNKSGNIIEVKEIKQFLELPIHVFSTLIRVKIELKKVVDKKDEILKELIENYKNSHNFDEEKSKTDADYSDGFNEEMEIHLSSKESAISQYLEEECKLDFKKIKIDIGETLKDKSGKILHMKKIDPKGLFKISYIPFSLIEEGIIEIVD
jgi:predicted P-loop ATPase